MTYDDFVKLYLTKLVRHRELEDLLAFVNGDTLIRQTMLVPFIAEFKNQKQEILDKQTEIKAVIADTEAVLAAFPDEAKV